MTPRKRESGHTKTIHRWGVLWTSTSKRDPSTHLIFENCLFKLFNTRRQARLWTNNRYGYIRNREDLRAEPHCWHMPQAVRVTVTATVDARIAKGKRDD